MGDGGWLFQDCAGRTQTVATAFPQFKEKEPSVQDKAVLYGDCSMYAHQACNVLLGYLNPEQARVQVQGWLAQANAMARARNGEATGMEFASLPIKVRVPSNTTRGRGDERNSCGKHEEGSKKGLERSFSPGRVPFSVSRVEGSFLPQGRHKV